MQTYGVGGFIVEHRFALPLQNSSLPWCLSLKVDLRQGLDGLDPCCYEWLFETLCLGDLRVKTNVTLCMHCPPDMIKVKVLYLCTITCQGRLLNPLVFIMWLDSGRNF